ncbi:hypothetical protein PRIPAC_74472, partial [Pristionchus pacificus]
LTLSSLLTGCHYDCSSRLFSFCRHFHWQLDVVVRRRNQQREVLEQHHQEMPLLPKRMKTWERIEKIPYSYDPRSS